MKKFLLVLFVSLFVLPGKVFAQNVDGTYYDWTVFTLDEVGKAKKCYIASFPKNKVGNHKTDRKPYVLITRYEGKKIEEVSVYNGYEYKINSEIYVAVEDQQYRMFTKGDIAWAKTMEQDKQMIQDMLKADKLRVRGESSVGTYSVDEYSLKGITMAYKRMKELCK
jgi:hypothetical protein